MKDLAEQSYLYLAKEPRWLRKKKELLQNQDRFIPLHLNEEQKEVSSYNLKNTEICTDEYTQKLDQRLLDGQIQNSKILTFTQKPKPPSSFTNPLKVVYSQHTILSPKKKEREINRKSERILDAPNLIDDFYINILDWSSNDLLGVGLSNSLYVFDYQENSSLLLTTLDPSLYISSLSWTQDGNFLSIGTSNGKIQLWDVERKKCIRVIHSHERRVTSISWNQHILTSGGDSIVHSDVRTKESFVSRSIHHEQEICGLKWSPDGKSLSTGGNDNLLCIWDKFDLQKPKFEFNEHTSAVRAMNWCPWDHNLLVTGGGTNDRKIRFWNTSIGKCQNIIDTESQVCSLLWSKTDHELLSSHGFSRNEIVIWKYPSMKKVTELLGHRSRVLHTSQSPNGSHVVSASGDETLRFWNVFTPVNKKKMISKDNSPLSIKDLNIR